MHALKEPSTIDEESVLQMPPVIQQIADERAEFQMNLGKAMDTLRKDYPHILHKRPGTRNGPIHHSGYLPTSRTHLTTNLQTSPFTTRESVRWTPRACN